MRRRPVTLSVSFAALSIELKTSCQVFDAPSTSRGWYSGASSSGMRSSSILASSGISQRGFSAQMIESGITMVRDQLDIS